MLWYNFCMQDKKQKWLVVANWKMNPTTLKVAKQNFISIKKTANKLRKVDTVVCPPFLYIESLRSPGNRCVLGAQDLFYEAEGSFTGQVSYLSLRNSGVKYCIIGHSEKRSMGETEEGINKKIKSSLRGMITPILCVGESVRDSSGEYLILLKKQIEEALLGLPKNSIKDIIIAYEPLWAIGKDAQKPATKEEVFEVVIFIKKIVSDIYNTKSVPPTKILYGGSVNEKNIAYFAEGTEVDGFLVGRASLNPKVFNDILKKLEIIKR